MPPDLLFMPPDLPLPMAVRSVSCVHITIVQALQLLIFLPRQFILLFSKSFFLNRWSILLHLTPFSTPVPPSHSYFFT
jgi:hypothetical protein